MNHCSIDVVSCIEHTLLKAEARPSQIDNLCDEAIAHSFAGVCINPIHVERVTARLASQSQIRVVSVVGFPLGANRTDVKIEEARRALGDGAKEIDLVPPLGKLIAGDSVAFREEIASLADLVHSICNGGALKVIIEATMLTRHQIVVACNLCREGNADFVKTSTGFHPSGGATLDDVRFLHKHAAPLFVKAAGGIRNASDALAMVEAGATRIGTSSSVAIARAELQEMKLQYSERT